MTGPSALASCIYFWSLRWRLWLVPTPIACARRCPPAWEPMHMEKEVPMAALPTILLHSPAMVPCCPGGPRLLQHTRGCGTPLSSPWGCFHTATLTHSPGLTSEPEPQHPDPALPQQMRVSGRGALGVGTSRLCSSLSILPSAHLLPQGFEAPLLPQLICPPVTGPPSA